MKSTVRIQSLKNQAVIADKCHVAMGYFDRLRGLIGRTALAPGEAMLFPKCNDIHMWFMSIPIDVVFVRALRVENGATVYGVSSAHENVRPWKPLPLRDGKASETIELAAGTVRRFGIQAGDELCIS